MRTVDPVRHAARRRQILDGAAEAITAKGFDNTTVKDICAAAGVGSGTLFHYFADKRAILHALLEADRDRVVADLGTLTAADIEEATDPAARAAATFWAIVERATADLRDPAAGTWLLAILGQLPVDPRVGELLLESDAATQAALRSAFAVLQRHGLADEGWPPAHAARWVQSTIDGLYLRCADDDFDPDVELARLRLVLTRMLLLREPA